MGEGQSAATARGRQLYRSAEVRAVDGGYVVALGGHPLRTPAGAPLTLPCRALAEALAEEWRSQDERVRPETMPMTRLAQTAVDRVGAARPAVVEQVAAYGATDLVCYRSDHPPDLAARQDVRWQPVLDWAAETYRAPLAVTRGLVPVAQPATSVEALRAAVAGFDDLELTAVASAVQALGSLVIGLALAAGRVDADEAFELAELDEAYQIERWGEDAEAADRRQRVRAEVRTAAAFLALARAGGPAEARRGRRR